MCARTRAKRGAHRARNPSHSSPRRVRHVESPCRSADAGTARYVCLALVGPALSARSQQHVRHSRNKSARGPIRAPAFMRIRNAAKRTPRTIARTGNGRKSIPSHAIAPGSCARSPLNSTRSPSHRSRRRQVYLSRRAHVFAPAHACRIHGIGRRSSPLSKGTVATLFAKFPSSSGSVDVAVYDRDSDS